MFSSKVKVRHKPELTRLSLVQSVPGERKITGGPSPSLVNIRAVVGGKTLPDLELLAMVLRLGWVHVNAQSAYHAAV